MIFARQRKVDEESMLEETGEAQFQLKIERGTGVRDGRMNAGIGRARK